MYPNVVPGAGSVFEGCDIGWTDFGGIAAYKAVNCNLNNNGDNAGTAIYMYGCTLTNNNYRIFSTGWHAGGTKYISVSMPPVTIEHCTVIGNHGPGIWFDTCISGNLITIRNNYIANNLGAGIFVEISTNALVCNNVMVGNEGEGIAVAGSRSVRVYNNTIVGTKVAGGIYPWTAGIQLTARGPSQPLIHNEVKNNIIFDTKTWVDLWISTDGTQGASDNICDYNCIYSTNRTSEPFLGAWGTKPGPTSAVTDTSSGVALYNLSGWSMATGFDVHSFPTDPLFVNASAGDFHLQSSSPIIDHGQTQSAVPFDNEFVIRPQGTGFDIGAFER
jgi:parallel beta-helix repeat protein